MDTQETVTVSMGDRMLNVFSSPSEAFTGLKDSPSQATLWLIPFSLFVVITVLFTYLLFANDTLKTQIFDIQARAMDQQVRDGAMSQAQADRIRDQMEGTGIGMFMVFGSLPAIFFICMYFFGGGLFLWLASKVILKDAAGYMKYVELYGVASWVGVLGFLVSVLMIFGMGSIFASPSAALTIFSEYDPLNKMHRLFSAMNIFSIWQASVIGIGLSKFSGKSVGMGIGVAFGLWIVWLAIAIQLGLVR